MTQELIEKKKIEQPISIHFLKRDDLSKLKDVIQEAIDLRGATHFDTLDSYGSADKSYDYSIEFFSYRDETDEEFSKRKEAVERVLATQKLLKDKQDLLEYERLKKKFQ